MKTVIVAATKGEQGLNPDIYQTANEEERISLEGRIAPVYVIEAERREKSHEEGDTKEREAEKTEWRIKRVHYSVFRWQPYPTEFNFDDTERRPHRAFRVRAVTQGDKRWSVAFSRLGIHVQEIHGSGETLATDYEKAIVFPKELRELSIRGEFDIRKNGTLEVLVATYHDRSQERKGLMPGHLFSADLTKDVLLEKTGIQTNGPLFVHGGEVYLGYADEGRKSIRKIQGAATMSINADATNASIIGIDRYTALNVGNWYWGYADNRGFLHLYNNRGYLGKTPEYGTIDDERLSISLPLPATSLLFVEGYQHEGVYHDYVVVGLQNGLGEIRVFRMEEDMRKKTKAAPSELGIDELKLVNSIQLFKNPEQRKQVQDSSVKNLCMKAGPEHAIQVYWSVGNQVYQTEFGTLLSGEDSHALEPIDKLPYEITSLDIFR